MTILIVSELQSPMLLLDSQSPLVTATCLIARQAPLIPKLRGQFAEFP